MVCCDGCNRWVHAECDRINAEKYQEMSQQPDKQYLCPECRSKGVGKEDSVGNTNPANQ